MPTDAHASRLAFLDRLKTFAVVAVISGHAVMGYAEVGSWPYEEVREVVLSPTAEGVVAVLLVPPGLFLMPLFFFIGGMLAPGSLARKGRRRFVVDRLRRFGVPVAFFALVLWPLCFWWVDRVGGSRLGLWRTFLEGDPFLDPGPLWFVLVLLLFSVGLAFWPWPARRPSAEPSPGRVAGYAAAIAVGTFALRLAFPVDSSQVLGLHLWQWASCLGLFCLGASAPGAWTGGVSRGLRRWAGWAALTGIVLTGVVVLLGGPFGYSEEQAFGGLHGAAAAMAVVEGLVTVGTSLWLVGLAAAHDQRRDRPPGRLARRGARAAYGAYVVQAPVLIALAMALRPVPAPAEVKAPLLATLAVTASFGVAHLLVTRTALGRVL
jgi:hypothetical protein